MLFSAMFLVQTTPLPQTFPFLIVPRVQPELPEPRSRMDTRDSCILGEALRFRRSPMGRSTNSRQMTTCAKPSRNSRRFSTSVSLDLKFPRINTYEKSGEGGGGVIKVGPTPTRALISRRTPARSARKRIGASPRASGAALASAQAFCENPAMPPDTDLQIRPARESDTPLVLDFIRKLAEYGDISSEATVTEADLRMAFFGPRPVAEAILAHVGGEPAGFAVYSFTFSSFMGKPGIYVEDLFV